MAVYSGVSAMVLQDDNIAVAALPASKCDCPIRCGLDSRTRRRRIINAAMRTPRLENGMKPGAGKTGTDTGKLQRRTQECFPQILAIGSVITAFSIFSLKVYSPMRCSLIDEFHCQN